MLLACVAASAVVQAGLGDNPAFRVPRYQLQGVAELPLVLALGALGGVVSAIFLYSSQVCLLMRSSGQSAEAVCAQNGHLLLRHADRAAVRLPCQSFCWCNGHAS